MRQICIAFFLCLASFAMAEIHPLAGFEYGTQTAPSGKEWESPEQLGYNKEQPRAYAFHFSTIEEAKRVLPASSAYYRSLDGVWKFHWCATPDERPKNFFETSYDVSSWDDIEVPGCWNVQGLQKDGTMKYGVPIYVNQPVIFYHEVKEGDWKEGVMREPKDTRWTTYKYRNEVGSYRRTFSIPNEWKGRQVFVNFDGVDSFFYLWVNGRYIGFSKNSRNTAQFNITPYLNFDAENILAVEVYRNSDGSFLEAQDMFRLPGIIRSTYLTSSPNTEIRDIDVRTLRLENTHATLAIRSEIAKHSENASNARRVYRIYPVTLYTDVVGKQIFEKKTTEDQIEVDLSDIRQWSAEAPFRYVLVAELVDDANHILDRTSTFFGFRTVEIRDTKAEDDEFGLAGRYFYVNGKTVKLKGVNRHETNPSRGHAITREQMLQEVFLMKRGNINHVRLSHYSNSPYWYYLADKYGLYLEDEANAESHEYYYGKESLSHPAEWKAAHVARSMELVRAHVNHPSIVIWSLGNEGGPGDNYLAAYQSIKQFDKSRPVQYERNNDIVDMGSNQYPSVDWVRHTTKGTAKLKYPFHISEYAHSMGNSCGNLVDYWEAMEQTNFFCGAAIWDWVDQAIDTYTENGLKYLGYGGDHGDWPNDGMFCMNGTMLPDLSPKPQYFEVKKVYQNVGVKLLEGNKIEVFNKNYFIPLNYDVTYHAFYEGKKVAEGHLEGVNGLSPRQKVVVPVPADVLAAGNNYLTIEFRQPDDTPWAAQGYVQMAEQLCLHTQKENYTTLKSQPEQALKIVQGGTETDVQGKDFHVCFDDSNGSINTMVYHGKTVIEPGCGPKLDALRAPVDNDNWIRNQWFEWGLHCLQHRTTEAPIITAHKDGSVEISYNVISQGNHAGKLQHRPGKAGEPYSAIEEGRELGKEDFHFTTRQTYTVYTDGSITLSSSILSSDPSAVLPRLGYLLKINKEYDNYTYYGRGPQNNYADRKTGSFIGLYNSKVRNQFVKFPKPQSMGNREDVRWCSLTNKEGFGLQFISDATDRLMSTSALPWNDLQMTLAAHPHELPESDGCYLHLDCQVTGLGGNSCGQGGPLEQDRVKGELHQMKLIIRPVEKGMNLSENAHVTSPIQALCPVVLSHDKAGKVHIEVDEKAIGNISVFYTVKEPGKKEGSPKRITPSSTGEETIISLQKGGIVSAWYEGEENNKTTSTFERVESVPLEITYVSNEETQYGEVAANLIDGDPRTIWHTMYSITVAKHPHWIDFDCGEVKNIRGFVYLPRQDGGSNGNIKGYQLQASINGKKWNDICQGEFKNNLQEKKITFDTPCKARYLRFTALSSQRGEDFASGAEFKVLEE